MAYEGTPLLCTKNFKAKEIVIKRKKSIMVGGRSIFTL
jgi:hypothetical protein